MTQVGARSVTVLLLLAHCFHISKNITGWRSHYTLNPCWKVKQCNRYSVYSGHSPTELHIFRKDDRRTDQLSALFTFILVLPCTVETKV